VAWQEWDTADFWDLYATENNYRVADVDGRAWLFHANTAMVPLSESFSARQELMDQMMRSISEAPSLIVPFLADRLKVQQREAGVRHDLIDAVFAVGGEDDLVRLLARVKALQAFIETPEGADLLTGYKRAANILKREKWEGEGVTRLSATELEPQEAALVAALDAAEPKASAAVEAEDFTGAMAALASLREPIDAFFDHVTVNDPDAAKRARRLNLLMRFRDAVHRVADFSRIEG
jgi:glycyl-tRNA synthetase beta chain